MSKRWRGGPKTAIEAVESVLGRPHKNDKEYMEDIDQPGYDGGFF